MRKANGITPEKWILLGIPVLFLLGSLLHFLYDFLGEAWLVGLFVPINESVWEHMKMVLWPTILWWLIGLKIKHPKEQINSNAWNTGALAAVLTALGTIPLLFYFYTQAFGVEILWIDIAILLLANTAGQCVGLHIYRHSKGISSAVVYGGFVLLILLFMWYTINPPHIPLFQDGPTGLYGLQ